MAMWFEHEFTVPVPVEQAWAALLDVERVAPCLPGATLDIVEGDEFTGRMKVKVGPITVTYRGAARFEDVDKDAYSLKIKASGREARGSGTADATIAATLMPGEGETQVKVETTFNVTGRPAQFGRGVMAEVGGKLIDRFATNLAQLLQEAPADSGEERHLSAVPEQPDVHPTGTLRTSRTPDEEALDLLEIAGTPLLKRVAPVVGAIAVLIFIGWLIRRMLR